MRRAGRGAQRQTIDGHRFSRAPRPGRARFREKALVPVLMATALTCGAADFTREVQPLLEEHCTACHGSVKQLGGVRLDAPSGLQAATPDKVLASIDSGKMPPPAGDSLTPAELATLRDWLKSGAAWPAGIVLVSGGSGSAGADNTALARRIHDKIVASPAGPMAKYTKTIPGTDVSYDMVPVPVGEFLMGTPEAEPGHQKDESPVHPVRIEAFWMNAHEVTWDEYRLFMFANQAGESAVKDAQVDAVSRPTRPYVEMSFGMGINGYPAISMTQHAANKYAEWLSAKTGEFYRLPTEAEWEYACRAGSGPSLPTLATTPGTRTIPKASTRRWRQRRRMPGACTTCLAT